MIHVEIDIFSGMPNPTFYLEGSAEVEFFERVAADPTQLMQVNAQHSSSYRLGYREMRVTQVKVDQGILYRFQRATRITLPEVFILPSGGSPRSIETTLWLLSQYSKQSPDLESLHLLIYTDVIKSVSETTSESKRFSELVTLMGVLGDCSSTAYQDNRDGFNASDRKPYNNCYCFGANDLHNVSRNGRYAAPGVRAGAGSLSQSDIRSNIIIDRLLRDGWRHSCVPKTNLTIACVIQQGYDFHFYRRVSSGMWCHKPGSTDARNTDASGRVITNPSYCNTGNYNIFVGYFYQNNGTAYVD